MDGVRRKSLSEYLINNTGLFMDGVRIKPSPDIRKHSIRFDEDNFMQWLIVYYQNQGKIQISLIPWLMYRSRNRGILFFSIKVYIILHAARVQVKFRAWLLATMTQSTVYPERFVCRWFVEMFDNSSRTISGRGY